MVLLHTRPRLEEVLVWSEIVDNMVFQGYNCIRSERKCRRHPAKGLSEGGRYVLWRRRNLISVIVLFFF